MISARRGDVGLRRGVGSAVFAGSAMLAWPVELAYLPVGVGVADMEPVYQSVDFL